MENLLEEPAILFFNHPPKGRFREPCGHSNRDSIIENRWGLKLNIKDLWDES